MTAALLICPAGLPRALRFHLGDARFFSLGSAPCPWHFTSWDLPSICAEETINDAASCLYLLCISANGYASFPDIYPLDQPMARTLGSWGLITFYCIRVVLANGSHHTHTHTHTHARVSLSYPSPPCCRDDPTGHVTVFAPCCCFTLQGVNWTFSCYKI